MWRSTVQQYWSTIACKIAKKQVVSSPFLEIEQGQARGLWSVSVVPPTGRLDAKVGCHWRGKCASWSMVVPKGSAQQPPHANQRGCTVRYGGDERVEPFFLMRGVARSFSEAATCFQKFLSFDISHIYTHSLSLLRAEIEALSTRKS